jgi:hypothetical protein
MGCKLSPKQTKSARVEATYRSKWTASSSFKPAKIHPLATQSPREPTMFATSARASQSFSADLPNNRSTGLCKRPSNPTSTCTYFIVVSIS